MGKGVEVAVVAHAEKLTGRSRKQLKQALDDAGIDAPWFAVAKAKEAGAATRKALKGGADTVIVCGGDGTVRAASESLVGTDAALAVLPAGTANLFATGYSLPSDPAEIVELIVTGRRRKIDSACCNEQTFNVMAGTGFDAAMIDGADAKKDRLGMLAYVREGVRHARARDTFEATVDVDGNTLFEGPASCVLVGNIGTLKGGVEALPEASPIDGRLDVAVVTAAGLKEWASVLMSAVRHRQALSGHAHLGQGGEISVRLDGKRMYELDGGAKGKTDRLEFGVRPLSLTLCAGPD
jgi:YegS/Rv2252/BmrU family lipid kinase